MDSESNRLRKYIVRLTLLTGGCRFVLRVFRCLGSSLLPALGAAQSQIGRSFEVEFEDDGVTAIQTGERAQLYTVRSPLVTRRQQMIFNLSFIPKVDEDECSDVVQSDERRFLWLGSFQSRSFEVSRMRPLKPPRINAALPSLCLAEFGALTAVAEGRVA
jgi:hypothetical protein